MNIAFLVFQILTGNLVGTVTDETKGVLPGASVSISSPALPSGPSTTVTDERGHFRFPALPPGVYRLSIELSSFRSYDEAGLRVSLGATLEREVTLALASVAETVNVSDESPLLDGTEAGYSTNYGGEYAENLPLHRDSFFDLIKSAPGMSAALPGNEGGQVSAFGSSSNENLYLVDGTDFTGRSGGNAAIWLDPDVVGEVEIVGLGASAEYGEFQGAVFNVVSKSGGNDFRFDASYYGQFDSLTSQPIRYPCNCPEGETGYVRSKYRDFSTHVGGPLWKDRMWFFGGYQYRTDSDNFPGGAGPPSVEDDHRVFAKVNWQITPDLKLMANYQNDYWGYVDPSTVSRPYEVLNRQEGHDPAATFFHLTHLVSDRTLWEARVSGSYPSSLWTSASGSTLPYHYDGLTGYESGGPFLVGPGKWHRTDARGKLSHYATDFLGGDHDFKFGVQLGRADSADVSVFSSGAGVYYYDYGGYPFYAVFREPYVYGGASKSLGIFAEDTVRLGERLSVNLGLRYDRTWSISQDLPAVDHLGQETGAVIEGNGDVYLWSELSPRIGFSYKLTGDGKTLVRASWGRYRQGVFLRETAATHPGQTPTTTANFDPATGEYSDVVSVVDPTEQNGLDPQTKGPVTDQFSIGFDREVAKGVAVSATYARKNGSDFIAWKEVAGTYEPAVRVLPDGREIELQALVSPPEERFFLLTNPEELFLRYNGLTVTFEKRWSSRWQAMVSYTLSEAVGTLPSFRAPGADQSSSTFGNRPFGRDPNDYLNAGGNLNNDRTHMLKTQASFEIPSVGILVAANLQYVSGQPWAADAFVSLPQGGRRVRLETQGTRRLSSQTLLDLRLSKIFRFRQQGRVEILADLFNLANDTAETGLQTSNLYSPNLGLPSTFVLPFRVMLGAKFFF